MRTKFISHRNRRERGQTMLLVAVSIVSLLAMAALAIDVVTLYVARTEIQGAADAAALAGAKAIADSGLTTLPSADGNFAAAQTLAQSMAQSAIAAVLAAPNNQVAGVALAATTTFNFTPNANGAINNPRVTVALTRAGLPTFFAHIWGKTAVTVSTSATAEAYNPANMANYTQINPKGVKPWLVANRDPTTAGPNYSKFVDPATGNVVDRNVLTNQDFWLTADCQPGAGGGFGFRPSRCALINPPTPPGVVPPVPFNPNIPQPAVQYLPAGVPANLPNPNPNNVCPSCGSGSDYQSSIQCADMNPYQCGGGAPNWIWDSVDRINPNGRGFTRRETTDGVQCLIHQPPLGAGQDTINWANWPTNPMQISPSGGGANLLSTSSSIVSIPIIDVDTAGAFNVPAGAVTIIGFLQAFVEQIDNNNNIEIKVMNVVGCSSTPNGSATITGGNISSPIPIRLITPP
ncbi:MAG TPA: pilus assembly protein TadG-related protein [Terriglobales bacterium]|nr:pilus assembly protein TadG-related protein [Terriglobales bacterium]